MVRTGIGSAVMPSLAIYGAGVCKDEALSVHELAPQVRPREVFLLWQQGRAHSPLAARAIEIAVDVAANVHLPERAALAGVGRSADKATKGAAD